MTYILIFMCLAITSVYREVYAQENDYFRRGYTYKKDFLSFYKVHKTARPWSEAKLRCSNEGGYLFYPDNEQEALYAADLITTNFPKNPKIWIGINDILSEGNYQIYNGNPIDDIYIKWADSEPNNSQDKEDCLELSAAATMNDLPCCEAKPFICKKILDSMQRNSPCNMPNLTYAQDNAFFRRDYTYNKDFLSFYKVHKVARRWTEAKSVCSYEDGYLFYPENEQEAEYVANLINTNIPKNRKAWIGMSDILAEGDYETVDGKTINEIYMKWSNSEADYAGDMFVSLFQLKYCIELSGAATMNDLTCNNARPFVCKKTLASLEWNLLCDMPDPANAQDLAFFRRDYTYKKDFSSFYKVHKVARPWTEAKSRCYYEGGYLFYPENKQEAEYVADLITTNFPKNPKAWIGISDIIAEGDFETCNGIPIDEIYVKWTKFEPNDANSKEDCVELSGAATMNDLPCDKAKPFICKKTLSSMKWNFMCDNSDPNYLYNKELDKCYKFHTIPMNWTNAHAVCLAEQSYLAVINSQKEAEYLKELTAENKHTYKGRNYLAGAVHLGFHNMNDEGFTTVHGTPLELTGYLVWDDGQPDNENSELCGSMSYNGRLHDMYCPSKCYFICEYDVPAVSVDVRIRV